MKQKIYIILILDDKIVYPHDIMVEKNFLNEVQKISDIKDISSVFNFTQGPCTTYLEISF